MGRICGRAGTSAAAARDGADPPRRCADVLIQFWWRRQGRGYGGGTGYEGGKGKKDAGKGKAAEQEEAKPESIYVTEMKAAIKIEKGILRFRLTQIKNWALNRLKHQIEKS